MEPLTNTAPTKRPSPGNPFRPGNPGRPKGARNRISIVAEKLMAADIKPIVNVVVDAAKKGDLGACKLVIDKLVPNRKGHPVEFDMPDLTAAGVVRAFGAVVAAVAAGDITPEEGQAVAGILDCHRRALETESLEARLDALEQKAQK